MTDLLSWQTTTANHTSTETIAEKLAANLHGGEVIELVSDLGGGKTTFVRGLARGLGSTDHVASPTFKISNIYTSPKLTLHHFDFYRLPEPGLIANELAEVITEPDNVVVIEWAESVHHVLPEKRLRVEIENRGDEQRHLAFHHPASLSYLLKGLA